MAIQWQWCDKMGKVTIKQKQSDGKYKNFRIDVYSGNCFAVFINEYKDVETNETMYNLQYFFMNKKHLKNIVKDRGRALPWDVVRIELNAYYKCAKVLADELVKNGYKVTLYYKENKKKVYDCYD